mmetsp:Transcript_9195/g.19307  ORF Transcript_9195/g.19307 Transcript_9195/m.19307 type:complete len:131 (-) Transcript_9195:2184-2576(-)
MMVHTNRTRRVSYVALCCISGVAPSLSEDCGIQAGGALCPSGYCCSQYGWVWRRVPIRALLRWCTCRFLQLQLLWLFLDRRQFAMRDILRLRNRCGMSSRGGMLCRLHSMSHGSSRNLLPNHNSSPIVPA